MTDPTRSAVGVCVVLVAAAMATAAAPPEAFVAALGRKDADKQIASVAAELAKANAGAGAYLEACLAVDHPLSATAAADLALALARRRHFVPEVAAVTRRLLAHDDPFVRAAAEWACDLTVQRDNAGQEIAWPRESPPAWFRDWIAVPADDLVTLDYCRQLIVWGSHRTASAIARGSGAKVRRRAEALAAEILTGNPTLDRRATVTDALAEVRSLHERLDGCRDLADARRLWLGMRRAARRIVLARPEVDFDRILYIRRHPAHSHRNITGSQYPWVHKPGGDMYVQSLDPAADGRPLLRGRLGEGHVHGMDLWWDGDRLCFAWARQDDWPPPYDTVRGNDVFRLRGCQEPTHLYEVNVDGSGLRQVTDHPYWSDFEPTYCADGDIAFASDRSGRSSECGKFSADHTVINIYACRPDGSGLRRLSDNKDIDRYPHSLRDGTIAYTRWDYQERHFFEVHAAWTVRPDGTMSDALFNQHLRHPFAVRDIRSVPDATSLVAVASGHHTFAYGPVVLLQPDRGINTAAGLSIVTPYVRPQEGGMSGTRVPEGGVPDNGGLYQTPWAISDRAFLASYAWTLRRTGTAGGDNAAGFTVYLIDVHGHKELLARDRLLSCAFPMPIRPRERPPVLPDRTADRPYATCYVTDVYEGLGEGVARGEVRYLRVSQRVGWPLDDEIGAMRWIPGNAWTRQFGFWAWAPARVIGTVPVEADGSAHFQVPADTAVYFQALDARKREVYRMRSHVTLQAGEVRGCRGCHESQPAAPDAAGGVPLALARPAARPEPPPWGNRRLLGYEWLIQPILDRRCVRCHGGDKPAGGFDFTAATEDGFCRSYLTMFGRWPPEGKTEAKRPVLVSVSNRFGDHAVTRPAAFGSRRSRLIRALDSDAHRKRVDLTDEEWETLVTWVDANAPYFDTFYNRRPADGEPVRNLRVDLPDPFRPPPTGRWHEWDVSAVEEPRP
jgi:hypothetical protein